MQATKAEIQEIVLKPLTSGYSPRWSPEHNPKKFGEMAEMMVNDIHENRFTVEALRSGMNLFRQEWTMSRWPVFGELKAFLARGEKKTEAGDPTKPAIGHRRESPESWADHCLRTPNGQKAVSDGHALSLWEWAVENVGQYPGERDWAAIAATTATSRQHLETLRQGPDGGGPLAGTTNALLFSMAQSIADKNRALTEKYQ